jgi:hypothetical protein
MGFRTCGSEVGARRLVRSASYGGLSEPAIPPARVRLTHAARSHERALPVQRNSNAHDRLYDTGASASATGRR